MDACAETFKEAKALTISDAVLMHQDITFLMHYDSALPIRLVCDASPHAKEQGRLMFSHNYESCICISFINTSPKELCTIIKDAIDLVWEVNIFLCYMYRQPYLNRPLASDIYIQPQKRYCHEGCCAYLQGWHLPIRN